jgi:hypothetical protein
MLIFWQTPPVNRPFSRSTFMSGKRDQTTPPISLNSPIFFGFFHMPIFSLFLKKNLPEMLCSGL